MEYRDCFQNPVYVTEGIPNAAALHACVVDQPLSGYFLRLVLVEAARRKGEDHVKALLGYVIKNLRITCNLFRIDRYTYFAEGSTEEGSPLQNILKKYESSELCRFCFLPATLSLADFYDSFSKCYQTLSRIAERYQKFPQPVPEEFEETDNFFPAECWWEAGMEVNIYTPKTVKVKLKAFPTTFPENFSDTILLPHILAIVEEGKPTRVLQSESQTKFGIHGIAFSFILPLLKTGGVATPVLTAEEKGVSFESKTQPAAAWYYPKNTGKKVKTSRAYPIRHVAGGAWECAVVSDKGDLTVSTHPEDETVLRFGAGVYAMEELL